MAKSITVDDLDIYYGDFLAVQGVSMTIKARSVTAFIGPSGCGKSTFLRTLNRMHEVIPGGRVEGKVMLDDQDLYASGVDPVAVRAFMAGFFADGAVLLIHDAELRRLLETWVAGLDEEEFVELLPLVRRTFGTFSPAERRMLAERVVSRPAAAATPIEAIDLDRAAPALATVDLILGIPGCTVD